jgi:hypothetical protein
MIDTDAILERDTFINHWCVRCGCHGILIATPRYFTACPECLASRMKEVRESGVDLPDWFLYVERVAQRNVASQARALLASPTVRFDDFYKCGGCGCLVQQDEARYHVDTGTNSGPPYCLVCYAERAGRIFPRTGA